MSDGGPILIPISAGELLDRITILTIKVSRIADGPKRARLAAELRNLQLLRQGHLPDDPHLAELQAQLLAVNQELWDLEDGLRAAEGAGRFDQAFIEMARGVYKTNDRRSALKSRINELVGSALVEVKCYGTSASVS